jgi:predicted amidohydrolase YtcJ
MPALFFNGTIRTLGESGITSTILADDHGAIIAVGEAALHHPLSAAASRVDLNGGTALPGPVDSHVHLLWNAQNDLWVADLTGSRSIEEGLGRLAEHSTRRTDGWLIGHGFDHELFPTRAFPTKQDLDRVAPDRPCLISRVCYHAVVVNSKALELAGIESDTGLLTEDRMDPVYAVMPAPTREQWLEVCEHAVELAVRGGFTGAHVLIDTAEEARAFQELHRQGKLKIRVRLQIPYRLLSHLTNLGLSTGFGDEWLSIGGIKMFADGSMGARTAALTSGYTDDLDNVGELIHSPDDLTAMCREVHEAGCQMVIHAIGDEAMDVTMDAITSAAGSDTRVGRHRIEHASIVRPDQIQRLAESGIVCCIQPQFIVTDFWTVQRMGEDRKPWIYPFASMLKAGVAMSGGTDCPVEKLNALEAIGRGVTRDAPWRGEEISRGYVAEECLNVDQAWRLYTTGSAFCGFTEARRGTLEPGMDCDFIVLKRDPYAVDPKSLETMTPDLVVVGGRVQYRKPD